MLRILSSIAVILQLGACAGGGGGGGGANNPGTPTPSDPGYKTITTTVTSYYQPPVKVATLDPVVNQAGTGSKQVFTDTFTANISGGANEDVIVAGLLTGATSAEWGQTRLHMLSWENGTMVDKTAQWFPGNSNVVLGNNNVKFADFFKTGKTDMFVTSTPDIDGLTGPAYLYRNNGTNFVRQTIDTKGAYAHDSTLADVNRDGYTDFIIAGYGVGGVAVGMNNQIDNFTVLKQNPLTATIMGTSSIAAADFLNNGTTSLIATDIGLSRQQKLYSWTQDSPTTVAFTELATLPPSRFDLPKWDSYNFGNGVTRSHNHKAVAYDFTKDGVPDAIILSQPEITNGVWPKYSEIQFLKNSGAGSFTDVTDTTVVGYNTNTTAAYQPKFIDLNNDGEEDILLSGRDPTTANNSTQFLLRSKDGKYVAAFQNIMTNFSAEINKLQNTNNSNNTVNLVRGPGGKLYLVTASNFMNGTDRQVGIYLSELGATNATTPMAAADLIKSIWPYLTTKQVQTVIANNSSTINTEAGTGTVINAETLTNPVGALGFNSSKGLTPISGYITGVDIGDGQAVAQDQIGRGFTLNIKSMNVSTMNAFMRNTAHIDQHNLTSHAEYLVGGSVNTFNNLRVGYDDRSNFNTGSGLGAAPGTISGNIPKQYTVGVPSVYQNGKFNFGVQYTSLNTNPWVAIGGAWGSVSNSGILDHVVTYRDRGFSTQAGVMHVTTNLNPGLVTNITPTIGAWAESGYRYTDTDKFGDLGFYVGVKPVVLSGSVEANIPTAIDSNGNTVYSKRNLAIQNNVTGYARLLYTNMLSKDTMYRFSAMSTQTGQYRLMHEIKWFLP